MKIHKEKHGQSMMEYMILMAVVLIVLIVFMNPSGSIFRDQLNRTLDASTEGMLNRVEWITSMNP